MKMSFVSLHLQEMIVDSGEIGSFIKLNFKLMIYI